MSRIYILHLAHLENIPSRGLGCKNGFGKQITGQTLHGKMKSFYLKTRKIHQKIGMLLGQSQHDLAKEQFTLDILLANLVASSAIENETLNNLLITLLSRSPFRYYD